MCLFRHHSLNCGVPRNVQLNTEQQSQLTICYGKDAHPLMQERDSQPNSSNPYLGPRSFVPSPARKTSAPGPNPAHHLFL